MALWWREEHQHGYGRSEVRGIRIICEWEYVLLCPGSCLEKLFQCGGTLLWQLTHEARRFASAKKDNKGTCGAGHAGLQMFVWSTLFWFSQRCRGLPQPPAESRSVAKWLLFSFQTHVRWVKSTGFAPCSATGVPDWSRATRLCMDEYQSYRDVARAHACTRVHTVTGVALHSVLLELLQHTFQQCRCRTWKQSFNNCYSYILLLFSIRDQKLLWRRSQPLLQACRKHFLHPSHKSIWDF